MKNRMLLFFGAPGVGKGTQAKKVSARLDIPHISTGDILRNAVRDCSEIGLKTKDIMDRGELVPDDIMIELVKNVLEDEKSKNGFILDGFPRTLQQAKLLQPIVDDLFNDKLSIISLDADDELIVNRLSQRRMCRNCSSIINLLFLENPDKCPNCGTVGSFIKRKDDEEDVIRHRMEIFHETTEPVLNYYRENAVIHSINGSMGIDEITEEIMKVLN